MSYYSFQILAALHLHVQAFLLLMNSLHLYLQSTPLVRYCLPIYLEHFLLQGRFHFVKLLQLQFSSFLAMLEPWIPIQLSSQAMNAGPNSHGWF